MLVIKELLIKACKYFFGGNIYRLYFLGGDNELRAGRQLLLVILN
jgi:hypothetical protein